MASLSRRCLLLRYCTRPVTVTILPQVHTGMRMQLLWTSIASLKSFMPKLPEERLSLPTSGFQIIEADLLVEEEELPDYKADRFYPVRLGDVFEDRYQVIAKLGFGSSSTIWLARDLKYLRFHNVLFVLYSCNSSNIYRDHQYVALKTYVHTSKFHRELPFYDHISPYFTNIRSHRGRHNIRRLLSSFQITGPHGKHTVLVFQASQMSLRDMKFVFFPKGFNEGFVKGAIIELLEALDFLHTHGEVIHTGMPFVFL